MRNIIQIMLQNPYDNLIKRGLKMNKLYEHLIKIRLRPELYFNEKSLKCLDAFILGYIVAQEDMNQEQKLFEGFEEYVHSIYHFPAYNSSQIIKKICDTDDRAFEFFYELLEKFLEQQKL